MTNRRHRWASALRVVALALSVITVGALCRPALAQQGQQGPSWEWLVGILVLVVGTAIAWGFRLIWTRIDEAHASIGKLRDNLQTDHITERETREMIGTSIRLALAEQLPLLLQPLRDDVGRINERLARGGVYRAAAMHQDDGA